MRGRWWRQSPARDSGAVVTAYAAATAIGSVPFWLAGRDGRHLPGPFTDLPVSALVVIVPAGTALLMSRRAGGTRSLVQRFRPRRVGPAGWAAALAVGALPTLLDGLARGGTWRPIPLLPAAGVAAVYTAAALAEELGWTTFAGPRLLQATGSTRAAALLSGGYWAAWHLIPFQQTGQSPSWVAGQCVQAVLLRAGIVGLSARYDEWGALAVVAHTATYLAWTLAPTGYRPWVYDLLAAPIVATILRSPTPSHL